MKEIIILLLLLNFSTSLCHGQDRTVGTIILEPESMDGYTFFSPFSGSNAYMVDNCGNLINQWDRESLPGLAAYFRNDGNVLRTYKVNPVGPFTSASNAGGIEIVDWNNNTLWSYEINSATELSHHDAVMLSNGNILVLSWELIQRDELIRLGRDPGEIAPQGFVWGERIIELRPVGSNEAEIVWEWRIKDHFVQDIDTSLSNFGLISENASLFDINLPDINSNNSHSDFDYNHFNAIDYHEELDQILLSVRNSDEIWILDHSTTTAEAASHDGGNSGMGGDILYRWGNPSAYQGASISKQRFFGQHGANWIPEGPDKDKILIYNNGNGRPGTDYSTIEILEPPYRIDGTYEKIDSEPFGPIAVNWKYGDDVEDRFYSPFLSNAQYLKNGNILINAGSRGEIFEITYDREVVWKYIIPLFGDFPATQGDNINSNATFRAYKYSTDFLGFEDLDIEAGAPIELEPILFAGCESSNSTLSYIDEPVFRVYASKESFYVEKLLPGIIELSYYDIQGSLIQSIKLDNHMTTLPTANISSGTYIFIAKNLNQRTFIQKCTLIK